MPNTNTARKRGRPRRNGSTGSSGIVEQVRGSLNDLLDVCENCHRPQNEVAPLAKEIGVSPVILAKFMKGIAGVSMETFDKIHSWLQSDEGQSYEGKPVSEDSDETSTEAAAGAVAATA